MRSIVFFSKIICSGLFLFTCMAMLPGCFDSGPTTARATIIKSRQQIKEQRTSPLTVFRCSVSKASLVLQFGAPSVKGRRIWGELVPYGEVWRMGANEASWLDTDKAIRLAGKYLAAGRYGLFAIPGDSVWTVIVNREWDQWGAYYYSDAADVFRVEVPIREELAFSEVMQLNVENGQLCFRWLS